MCFSASASFSAGAVLTVIGVMSVRKTTNIKEKPFALLPFVFGIQQISEGFLWQALENSSFSFLREFTTHTFLFFAQVVWPFLVPFSIFLIEKKPTRKKILLFITFAGALVSIYLAYCLAVYPVSATIVGYHISYQQDYPLSIRIYGGILYVVATIGPALISSVKRMWILGGAILVSYILTTILYPNYLISVWCFFAAVISLTVFAIILKLNEQFYQAQKMAVQKLS